MGCANEMQHSSVWTACVCGVCGSRHQPAPFHTPLALAQPPHTGSVPAKTDGLVSATSHLCLPVGRLGRRAAVAELALSSALDAGLQPFFRRCKHSFFACAISSVL
jgi:hypothetical protein